MLGNAIRAFPDAIWSEEDRHPQPWHLAFHTLFYLDLYLSGSLDRFAPPEPFTLSELDPAGVVPATPYSKAQLLTYLDHCRQKCRATLADLDAERATRTAGFDWVELPLVELHLYNLRHVQHGAAQLNLILRQAIDAAPGWVKRTVGTLDNGE